MERSPIVVDQNQARKRKSDPSKWKRNLAKLERYSSSNLPERPDCTHKKKFKCKDLSMNDLITFHTRFYKHKTKTAQDTFILKHMKVSNTKRHRPRKSKYKPRETSVVYNVYSASKKIMLQVCQKAFLEILGLKRYRVENIAKQYREEGVMPREKRGGDHKSHKYLAKQSAVIDFIKSLKCSEPHYCRGSSQRLYLPAELSINRLWKMYNVQAETMLKVKRSYFRNIFNTKFNLGFGSPQTDVCSVCLQLLEKIKLTADENIKKDLMIQKTVHMKRAKAFYTYLKDTSPNIYILSYDCQKNMPLPKIPDQSTYYSRQFYVYNFTMVSGPSKSALNKENTFSYIWTENEFSKDSNLIASAVFHRLNNTVFPETVDTLRLMADGCAGQNKNMTVIGMCQKWLSAAPKHIKKIEIIFPVVGHSFLPADRVFGRIEKEFRKRDTVLDPDGYINIIKEHSTVIQVSNECPVLDWKNAVKTVTKDTGSWHIPFMKCKRFILKRSKLIAGGVVLKGELNYTVDLGVYRTVSKKGKTASNITPVDIMPSLVTLKASKIKDVNKLLTSHFGDNWRGYPTLTFYTNLIPGDIELEENEDQDQNNDIEPLCEHYEEIPNLTI